MSRYFTEAVDLIQSGEYRQALKRLERARAVALCRGDIEAS